MNHRAPLLVATLILLLPSLYVASYLTLVVPGGFSPTIPVKGSKIGFCNPCWIVHYRLGWKASPQLFWPLEQIDRKVRPQAWLSAEDRFWNEELSGRAPILPPIRNDI